MATKKLYPFKFVPYASVRVWGGDSLITKLDKKFFSEEEGRELTTADKIAESWEIANMGSVEGVVENGFLTGNTMADLMETYMEKIVGEKTFKNYGTQFPLLIKYLDIRGELSFQVHPDDKVALERYDSLGKSEVWYIVDASEDATIYMGFAKDTNAQELWDKCHDQTVLEIVNKVHPKKGDVLKIVPGTVHAATGDILVAEVQESSDLTFRLYDWGREFNPATARKMHLEEALDVIDYKKYDASANYLTAAQIAALPGEGGRVVLAEEPQYKLSKLTLTEPQKVDTAALDTFLVYMCLEGSLAIYTGEDLQEKDPDSTYVLRKGETTLIPADVTSFYLIPLEGECTVLETYTPPFEEEDSYVGDDCDDDDCDCHEHHDHCDHDHCDCGHDHEAEAPAAPFGFFRK